jgi:hypothetical protein
VTITIGFIGHTTPDLTSSASAFENDLLPLLARVGATVRFRGVRHDGQDDALPYELHVLEFPSEHAFAAYLADPDRAAIIERHGEVFTTTTVVRLDPIA